jgi:Stage II sporulation protein E (SpoIIE)/GAF domain
MTSLSQVSPASDPPSFRARTLARLVDHVRALIPVGAVTFATVEKPSAGGQARRGRIERSAGWFADERHRDAFDSLLDAVLERDRPLFLPRVDAWEAAPKLLGAADEALASASVIACPLHSETGDALGVLLVASLDPERPLRKTDLSALEVVADLAAMALERADLLEEEGRRAREGLRLKRAVEAVSASLELDEVYRRVAEHAAEATGATQALLTRFDARSGELRSVASADLPGAPADRLTLESDSFGRVARNRIPLLDEAHAGSLMHAPIELGPRLYGVLTVAHDERGRFGDAELDLLARFARSSAAAIANAIDFGRERHIARALTLGFVPESLPALAGYETGLLYAPALGEPTGGDVYGAWQLPGGDIAVLVGDVAGKGVETAALSAMVRFFVEARSWDTRSPAIVLEQTNSMLMERLPPDTFVTAFYGVLSPGSLRWAGAGHLPPLHVSGSTVRPMDARGLPLGIDAQPRYGESELELDVGDLVFAFTDGLIEARRDGETFGMARLSELVGALAQELAPEVLVRAVNDEVADWAGAFADDAVALALRRCR